MRVAGFKEVRYRRVPSPGPDVSGAEWDSSGIQRLASVDWQMITTPVAETFCSRADPFC